MKIQVKAIIVKFLIKNLLKVNEDRFLKDTKQHLDTPKHFSGQHRMFLQEYIATITGERSAHRVDIWEYSSLKYTKDSVWKFISTLWKRHIEATQVDQEFSKVIDQRRAPLLPCSRKTEVFLGYLTHGKLPLNQFMWNRSLVEYPTCSLCDTGEVEDAKHLVYECSTFNEERKEWRNKCLESGNDEFTLLESVMLGDKELLLKVCKLASAILIKRFKGNLDFWPK